MIDTDASNNTLNIEKAIYIEGMFEKITSSGANGFNVYVTDENGTETMIVNSQKIQVNTTDAYFAVHAEQIAEGKWVASSKGTNAPTVAPADDYDKWNALNYSNTTTGNIRSVRISYASGVYAAGSVIKLYAK